MFQKMNFFLQKDSFYIRQVLIFVATFVIFYVAMKNKQYLRILWLVFRLPGPIAYPFIGNTYMAFNHTNLKYLGSHAREIYGSVIRAWVAIFPVIFVVDPKDIHKILSSKAHIEKPYLYDWLTNLVGRGLVTSQGSIWKRDRRMIQPSFNLSALKQFSPNFEAGIKSLKTRVDQSLNEKKSCLNVVKLMNEVVFEILSEVVLGMSWKSVAAISETKSTPFQSGSFTIIERFRRPWLMFEFLYRHSSHGKMDKLQGKLIENCTNKLIDHRKQSQGNGTADGTTCFLDFMLGLRMPQEECVHHIATFMLAGQDTVAGALSFTLYLLATHPYIQEKARAEVDDVTKDRDARLDDANNFLYLEQCIKETLRLFPSITVIARKLGEDVQLDNYCLPKGTDVIISPYAAHRLPEHFSDPEIFNPDRFSKENSASRHPCAYIPFSVGPRNCIGSKFAMIKMLVIIANVLKSYDLTVSPENKELSIKYRLTIRASGGIWITFSKRCK